MCGGKFNFKDAKINFDVVFRHYNFVALASEDNKNLRDPFPIVVKLRADVDRMRLPTLTGRKRKTEEKDNAGNGPPKKSKMEGGHFESDVFSDVAILEAMNRAGYTIPDRVEGFELLLPVRASFP